MENQFQLPRGVLAFAIGIPLALIVGFFLILPDTALPWMLIGVLLMIGSIPIFLKYHHLLLILGANAYVNAFFLPGEPSLWLLLAAVSFGIAFLDTVLGKKTFIRVRSLDLPLLLIAAAVVFTLVYRGEFGLRSFGGASNNGKWYFYLIGSIVGYYALTSQVIPKKHATLLTSLFFLSGITAMFSNLAYVAGPSFYFLFSLFPAELAMSQAASDYSAGTAVERIGGLSFAAMAVFWFLLMRYGIRGIFDVRKPWRFLILCGAGVSCLLGGFRSLIILFALVFAFQFWYEKLFRTRYLVILLGLVAFAAVPIVSFSTKLPLAMQRALSFLPIDVDPMASADATSSLDWRLDMWKALLPDVPKYFWAGKGYAFDPIDYTITQDAVRRGLAKDYDPFIIAGNYHSGPFSLIIPFGIWGFLGFTWLIIAGCRVLYRNYRYGDPRLLRINTFLLAYFIARSIFFFVFYGAFNSELLVFTGVLGLSISVNGGMCSRRCPVPDSKLQRQAINSPAPPAPQPA